MKSARYSRPEANEARATPTSPSGTCGANESCHALAQRYPEMFAFGANEVSDLETAPANGSGSPTVVLEPGLGGASSDLGWVAPAVAALGLALAGDAEQLARMAAGAKSVGTLDAAERLADVVTRIASQ